MNFQSLDQQVFLFPYRADLLIQILIEASQTFLTSLKSCEETGFYTKGETEDGQLGSLGTKIEKMNKIGPNS